MRTVLGALGSRARSTRGDDFLTRVWPGIPAQLRQWRNQVNSRS